MKLKTLKDLTSWTCECNCVTFDNGICRACGKPPKYGEIDYEELKAEAVKRAKYFKKQFDETKDNYWEGRFVEAIDMNDITEEDLK